MKQCLIDFFRSEPATGVILGITAGIAMLVANSALAETYHAILHQYWLGLSLSHWINDGLMAIFFLYIGLEVKRELVQGALQSLQTAIFPAIAAVGGMFAPALIYLLFNFHDAQAIKGWAIPAATDIAFALGVLALLGSRVPNGLKVFLLALAIIDDLGVIVIIALFYSNHLSLLALAFGLLMVLLLWLLNFYQVRHIRWYLLVGFLLWLSVLQSGVHATLAGVVIGFAIPLKQCSSAHQADGSDEDDSPLLRLEHTLKPYVSFVILPLFAFANAGVTLASIQLSQLSSHVPLGVALGLLLGKPIGVFSFSWLAIQFGWAKLPPQVSFRQVFAVSVLCGIGFTMSIFISSLAFEGGEMALDNYARLGILLGSTTAAFIGYGLLRCALPSVER